MLQIIITIFLISVGLSMDTLVVSLAAASTCKNKIKYVFLRFAFTMGFIQSMGILTGYIIGSELEKIIKDYDHWIAFLLLLIIGGKMLFEGFKHKNSEVKPQINMNSFFVVTGLGIATSIDAGIVGIGISLAGYNIFITAFIVFVITFLFSYLGLFGGHLIRTIFKKMPAEHIGGIVLILIGIKILLEHTFFS